MSPTAVPSERHLWLGRLLLGLAILWQLVLTGQSYAFLSYQVLAADDAFYYFQIVRNLVRLGWSTFDGLHASSGVQLLWTVVLVPIAWLIEDRMLFVRTVMVLCVGLNLATGLMLRRFVARLHSPLAGECMAGLWAVVLMVWLSPTLTGMEYPLHTAVIAATLVAGWPLVAAPAAATAGRVWLTAGLLTLNFWTRLDSAFYSLALGAFVAWRLWSALGRDAVPHVARLVAVPAAGALGYVSVCRWMAGTWTPISGLVKSVYANRYFEGVPASVVWRERIEWWIQIQIQPVVDLVATPAGLAAWTLPEKAACLAIGGALALWGAWQVVRNHDGRSRPLGYVAATLLGLGGVHVVAVIASVAAFSYTTRHYYAWQQITWCLVFSYVAAQALSRLPRAVTRPLAGLGIAALVAAQVAAVQPRFAPAPNDLKVSRFRAIQWAAANLPPDAVIGAWNAGQVGYFLDRPVVNLDGLVNDAAYAARLRDRRPLIEYLRHEGIDYVMDYNSPDLSMPYHAYWKSEESFRNTLSWNDVTVLHLEPAEDLVVHVLRVKPGPTTAAIR